MQATHVYNLPGAHAQGISTNEKAQGAEGTLECGREAAAFGFSTWGILARTPIKAASLKRQLRGRSPKRFAQIKKQEV